MDKKLSFLILLLVIAGCTDNDSDPSNPKLYTGTSGVLLTTSDQAIPDAVNENEIIIYSARIENAGPYSTDGGRLVISVEKGFMEFEDENSYLIYNDISLAEKTHADRRNDFTVTNLPILVKELDEQSKEHEAVILTTFCYDYRGIAVADICVDTDPYNTRSAQKACSLQSSISLSGGQGGPVVIDRIEPRMLLDRTHGENAVLPQFKIYVANKGPGIVFKPGYSGEVCSEASVGNEVYNIVTLDKIEFSGFTMSDFDCTPEELILINEEGTFNCILNAQNGISTSKASYPTPLTVEISYGYMESRSKSVKIEKTITRRETA